MHHVPSQKSIVPATKGLTPLALISMSTIIMVGQSSTAMATPPMPKPESAHYTSTLHSLNNSGASGKATLSWEKGTADGMQNLDVNLKAKGLVPNQIHAVHIHGKDNPEVATCPTTAVDTNKDGFVSVVEGAATYGPIKMNLTSPQTPFGAPPTLAIFTPFAGTPDMKNFPMADAHGNAKLKQVYNFDKSSAAQGALKSITPLENQHIVVHGGMAPTSVDTDAFTILGAKPTTAPETVIYDALLPVACGEIEKSTSAPTVSPMSSLQSRVDTLASEFATKSQNALATYTTDKANGQGGARDHYINITQSARDHYINQVFEARNQAIDQLNRAGLIAERDEVITYVDQNVQTFSDSFELLKNNFMRTDSQR